jgi:hypothetical protein
MTAVSWVPPEGLTFEEWEQIGRGIMRLHGASKWWLGDWLLYGEGAYGEQYSQALSSTDYRYQTLVNAASVSRRVESYRRRENLSWSHHEVVAKCEPSEQVEWLRQAEEKDWTVHDLRDAIRPPPKVEVPPPTEVPPEVKRIEPVLSVVTRDTVPPDLVQPSVDVAGDLEAWSRRRIGLVWSEENHLTMLAMVGKVLAGG